MFLKKQQHWEFQLKLQVLQFTNVNPDLVKVGFSKEKARFGISLEIPDLATFSFSKEKVFI